MEIDDSFYNRQRYVLGDDAMKKMSQSAIYLYGLKGLGLEIAKNLVLGGIYELYLDDETPCETTDLGSQFYISNIDIQNRKTRAQASLQQITELNSYVKVRISPFTLDSLLDLMSHENNVDILINLEKFSCIILTNCDLIHIGILSNFCRAKDIKLIVADVYGLFGVIFCDFGDNFTITTENDEENVEFFIGSISNEKFPVLNVLNDDNHGLSNDDLVTFKDIDGMHELNAKECDISVISRSSIRLKLDTSKFSRYIKNGICTQKKRQKTLKFSNFFDQSFKPTIINPDYCRLEFSRCIQLLYLALKRFQLKAKRMPIERNELDYAVIKSLLDSLNSSIEYQFTSDCWSLVKSLCNTAAGELQPLNAVFGGIAAQEAIKAVTHKFTPIQQWFVMECQCLASKTVEIDPVINRYESLRRCIGSDLIEKLHNLRVFMVGCGAIGCELLKNMAMIGVSASGNCRSIDTCQQVNNCGNMPSRLESSGDASFSSAVDADDDMTTDEQETPTPGTKKNTEVKKAVSEKKACVTKEKEPAGTSRNNSSSEDYKVSVGQIIVTDNDLIEKSNLNRQFLFKHRHIKQSKSVTARHSVIEINSDVNIEAHQNYVGHSTENVYNNRFFQNIDICLNALDNIEGRRYMDSRCVINQRCLIESGTMSTKGHVQVIIPQVTENYSNQSDPQEIEIPYCTLKSFPAKIEHCIEWAREKFESNFYLKPYATSRCLNSDLFDPQNRDMNSYTNYEDLVKAIKVLKNRPTTFRDCVEQVRVKFELNFRHKALQLLHSFPIDTRLEDGTLFWQLPKRPPQPLTFDIDCPLHWLFIYSYSKMIAIVYGIDYTEIAVDQIKQWAKECHVPIFVPNNRHVETDENVKRDDIKTNELKMANMEINDVTLNLVKLHGEKESIKVFPIDFEKDKELHIDFIAALSNLRARMYGIDEVDASVIKRISGRIIPAIATTTSVIGGLVMIELLKVVMKLPVNNNRNSFINLSQSHFVLSEPGNCQHETIINNNGGKLSFSIWDHWNVFGNASFTVNDLINNLEEQKGLTSNMILQGNRIIYLNILPGSRNKLDQKLNCLLQAPPDGEEYTDLLISYANNSAVTESDNGEDIKGPRVRYWFRKLV